MERKMEEDSGDIHQMELGKDDIMNDNNAINSMERRMRQSFSDKDLQQQWAAIERLPTDNRLRTSLFFQHQHIDDKNGIGEGEKQVWVPVDVGQLGPVEMHHFMETQIKHIEQDNLRFLQKQRSRLDRVNMKQPTIEVRYKNLSVEAECEVVQGTPLPTLWNSLMSMISGVKRLSGLNHRQTTIRILNDVSGVIKPASTYSYGDHVERLNRLFGLWKQRYEYIAWTDPRFAKITLLLGSPGCGKSTFLRALSGKLDKSLKVNGEISYNGYRLDEFVPEKTSAYISQHDLHIPEMTVREVLDFSARFQGVGSRADILKEVLQREKDQGITPDPDVDVYMKAISLEGLERNLQTDYIMKIMGLDICADTIVGDAMRRGISGGERKRLTTGEMIIGPSKALFMDEISTGLDSSTTYQIVSCLQQLAHISESTVVVSLLQPAPETYNLFDDIILMAEGKIVYHGPRDEILKFFEECGFKCPERKGAADFLQEVLSKMDQEQYWSRSNEAYRYLKVDELVKIFRSHKVGWGLSVELAKPYDKLQCHKHSLSFRKYSLSKWELFKACFARELLLMRRNSFVYIFKSTQLGIIALITGTVFLRTRMAVDKLHSNYYLGSLFFALFLLMVNGTSEVAMTVKRLPIFYKQRDLFFYPAWAYSVSASVLKIPVSLQQSVVWTTITYFVIGFTPEASRYFRQLLLLFFVHSLSLSMVQCIASYFQTAVASLQAFSPLLVLTLYFGGFVLPRPSMPQWLQWGFWVSPLTYAEIGLAVNEFLAPRWQKMQSSNVTTGTQTLKSRGLYYAGYYYWIGVGALIGFILLFNFGFTLALTFKRPYRASKAIICREKLHQLQGHKTVNSSAIKPQEHKEAGRMVLPFMPLIISFQDLNYYVDVPPEMKEQGYAKKRLQLLHNITGAFRPSVLSALMGVTGAGKTTLLDVLSGRKTGGYIEGQIRIDGYPKVQETFARISAYCEQTDIHSPQITVEESVAYSAWLRLPEKISAKTRHDFVNEVIETIELDPIRDVLVGLSGLNGLSTEQRKRLTIAVELVSNPSVIFMDEPTSGLDARAAAIVMRAVKNVSLTGRTVVCTIHQPSIDIFEAFDELILMKRGGELIYSGPLGRQSCKVIEYFEGISGVPKIKDNYNPATWMLEVSSPSVEAHLGINFSHIYKESNQYKENEIKVKELSTPSPGSSDLRFETRYPQKFWVQFNACLWKQSLSYWRSPQYNMNRIMFMFAISVLLGLLFWNHGGKINNQQDLFNILGCMYCATVFTGIKNGSSTVPFVSVERTVVYRENFAGMYSPWAYSFAQVAIEIPYVLFQVVLFMIIAYPAIGFEWNTGKFMWFFYGMFCNILYMIYFGMMLTAMTPTAEFAIILQSVFYNLLNLFSGFIVPLPQIPGWWIWMYYTCPLAWTLNALITSQYGDVPKLIVIFGEEKSVVQFLEDYFGFCHDRLPLVAVILALYPIIFATIFAYFIGRINFQKR